MWTPELVTAIFTGLGLIVSTSLGFTYKVWKDHNRILKEMNDQSIKLVEKNIITNEKMTQALTGLGEATDRNTKVSEVTAKNMETNTDTLNKLMIELVRKS